MQSIVQTIGPVQFPQFMAERIYMREFTKKKGLPKDLQRWSPTVEQMLDGVDTDGPIFLMVDEKFVPAQNLHRRGGMHIDGYWVPQYSAHGPYWKNEEPKHNVRPKHFTAPRETETLYAGHKTEPGRHNTGPSGPRHGTTPTPGHRTIEMAGQHNTHRTIETYWPTEAIILASNIPACRAMVGEWDGIIGKGGDVSHLDFSHMREVMFEANMAYAGNVTFVHESLPVPFDCNRTVVRLNVPGYEVH